MKKLKDLMVPLAIIALLGWAVYREAGVPLAYEASAGIAHEVRR